MKRNDHPPEMKGLAYFLFFLCLGRKEKHTLFLPLVTVSVQF